MDAIRKQFEKPLVVGVVGFLIGTLFGLVVLGWGLWPVKWTDAAARDLRADAKIDYLRMMIESYAVNHDAAQAKARWAELQPGADQVMEQLAKKEPQLAGAGKQFQTVVQVTPATPGTGKAPAASGGLSQILLLGGLCFVLLFVAAALVGFLLLRKRQPGASGISFRRRGAAPAQEPYPEEGVQAYGGYPERPRPTEYRAAGAGAGDKMHIANYMSTYTLGDDLFDDMFSLDAPSGDFFGECGVGISDTIGTGDPKKVSALEVWLFDKNDTETVTRVLASKYAYQDQATRQKLLAKGELVLAEPGVQTMLETDSLILTARVVDMAYGEGAVPGSSFFERLTLELSIDRK